MISGAEQKLNLQIQANRRAPISAIRKLAPRTVAGSVLIGKDDEVNPEEVRDMFRRSMLA